MVVGVVVCEPVVALHGRVVVVEVVEAVVAVVGHKNWRTGMVVEGGGGEGNGGDDGGAGEIIAE